MWRSGVMAVLALVIGILVGRAWVASVEWDLVIDGAAVLISWPSVGFVAIIMLRGYLEPFASWIATRADKGALTVRVPGGLELSTVPMVTAAAEIADIAADTEALAEEAEAIGDEELAAQVNSVKEQLSALLGDQAATRDRLEALLAQSERLIAMPAGSTESATARRIAERVERTVERLNRMMGGVPSGAGPVVDFTFGRIDEVRDYVWMPGGRAALLAIATESRDEMLRNAPLDTWNEARRLVHDRGIAVGSPITTEELDDCRRGALGSSDVSKANSYGDDNFDELFGPRAD